MAMQLLSPCGNRNSPSRRGALAFSLIELVVVLAMLAMLACLGLPRRKTSRSQSQMAVDLNNVRQVLMASHLYATENNDYLAHPTWGGDLTGPDGWAYATQNQGRIPNGPAAPPSCAGQGETSAAFSNQVLFFKIGQLGPYLGDYRTMWCPKDVATRGVGRWKTLWLGRPVKLASYCWNGTIGGYVGLFGPALPTGKTYKLSDFLPTDWQMWEHSELDPFFFNDAGDNPRTLDQTLSRRHVGYPLNLSSLPSSNRPGGAIVGVFGGAAELVKWSTCHPLVTRTIPSPNEILNGPRFR